MYFANVKHVGPKVPHLAAHGHQQKRVIVIKGEPSLLCADAFFTNSLLIFGSMFAQVLRRHKLLQVSRSQYPIKSIFQGA